MRIFIQKCCIIIFCFVSLPIFAVDNNKSVTVNFVTEANYYPFEYLDDNNQIQGFDIDIAKAICRSANLICKFHNESFDSLLLNLQFGRFDAAIAALDITEERKQKVDFSDSYYKSPPVFISSIATHHQFSIVGKFIGVQADSSNYDYLIKHAKADSFIIAYSASSAAFSDLSHGKIDVVFADQAVVDDFLLQNQNSFKFSIMRTEDLFLEGFSSGYGIAVKKGNTALKKRLNYGLNMIHNDGTYQQIFSQYFSY